MSTRKWLDDYADEHGEPILVLGNGNEFDEALLGICVRFGQPSIAIYDRDKLLEILATKFSEDAEEDEAPYETAVEWYDFNIIGAWVGEYTPAFAILPPKEEQ